MKRIGKRGIAFLMAFMMMLSTCLVQSPVVVQAAKKPVRLTMNIKNTTSAVGCTVKLKVAAVTPKKASKSVKWSSSNTKVATVSQKGVVKFRKTGTVVIKAVSKKNPKAVAKCKIKVYKATKKMQLTGKKSYILNKGKSITLKAKVTSPKKGYEPVKWASKNTKIAKVNAKGKVTAISKGKTVITGTSGNKTVKVTIQVNESSDTTNDSNTDDNKTPDSGENTETPTPNPTPQPTEIPTPNPTEIPTPKPTETPTESPTPEPTETPQPTETPTPEPTETPDTNACSREAWVSFLVDKLGLALSDTEYNRDIDTDEIIYSYADATDCSNPDKVETALHYGILPEINETEDASRYFEPKKALTKEYAAMTLVRALGFAEQQELTCKDADSLLYPKEDQVAVTAGAFSLQDGSFLPDTQIGQADVTRISGWIDGILNAREIDPDHENEIVYKDEVKNDFAGLSDYQIKEVDGQGAVVLPQNDTTKNIKAGDIIVLPANDEWQDGAVIAVSDVSENEESQTVIVHGDVPDIFDAVKELDLEGRVTKIDEEEVQTAKGVSYEDGTFSVDMEEFLTEEEQKNLGVGISGGDKIKLNKDIVDETIDLDENKHGKAQAKFTLDYIDYKFKLTTDGIDECYVKVGNTLSFQVTYSGKVDIEKTLADFPQEIGGGFSIHIQPKLILKASGELTVGVSYVTGNGIQYCNRQWNRISEENLNPTLKGSASGKVGAGLEMDLYWLMTVHEIVAKAQNSKTKPVVNLNLSAGVDAKADLKNNQKHCLSASVEPFCVLSALNGSLVADICKKIGVMEKTPSWDLKKYIKPISDAKWNWHWEDGKLVDKCTADTGQLQVTINNKNVRKFHFTVKDMDQKVIRDISVTSGNSYCTDLPVGTYTVAITAPHLKGFVTPEAVNIAEWTQTTVSVYLENESAEGSSTGNVNTSGSSGNTDTGDSTEPDQTNATMQVVVSDEGDLEWPIENASVRMVSTDGNEVTATTDTEGKAELSVAPGTYYLELTADGYEKITTKQFKVNPAAVMVKNYGMTSAPVSEETLKANWQYTVDEENGQVVLTKYIGESLDVKVGPYYQVGGKVYGVRIGERIFSAFYHNCKLLDKIVLNRVMLPESCGDLFYDQSRLKQITFRNMDTSNVTNMYGMFSGCLSLTSLDLSPLRTENVTDMGFMFRGCSSLTSLDLSPLRTENVTDMGYMFYECSSLTSLDLSSLRTENVTDMDYMFGCYNLRHENAIKVSKTKWTLTDTGYEPYMQYVD